MIHSHRKPIRLLRSTHTSSTFLFDTPNVPAFTNLTPHDINRRKQPPEPVNMLESGKKAARILCAVLAVLLLGLLIPIAPAATDPGPAIQAVAALTDPAKLATLTGERAANERLHKILAWLEAARRTGTLPGKGIDEAQRLTGDSRPHAAIVKDALLRNFTFCERAAVFTPENLARMAQGRAPLVTGGTYAGQPYEVDHIIPVADFPALGNELANLHYLARTQNRRKGDDMQQLALDLSQRLTAAGVLRPGDTARMLDIRRAAASGAETTPGRKVNLNRAAASTLEKLPGIGPKTAAAIIAARPLRDLADLDKVPGIGPKAIEGLKDLVSF